MSRHNPIVDKFAERYDINPDELLDILKATAFRQKEDVQITDAQMMALLVVADQHKLNPFTKEIYAYPDKGAIVAVVSVDGWARIVNEHPQCDGFEFNEAETSSKPDGAKECPDWIESVFYRKDRTRPAKIKEHLDETYRKPFKGKAKDGSFYTIDGPWQTHTKRFLRHKAFIQGARITFGFAGIYDEDEAQRIIEMGAAQEVKDDVPQPQRKSTQSKPALEAPTQGTDEDWTVPQAQTQQRQREPIQRRAQPRQQQAPVETQRQPGADDEQPGTAAEEPPTRQAAAPVSAGVMTNLKAKMEQVALGEADLRKRFGHGYDGVTRANYNDVAKWIEDPMGA